MRIKHKGPWYQAVRSSAYGILWTKHGLQIVRPGDYIVRAPTGCTWRLQAHTVNAYYVIDRTDDNHTATVKQLRKSNESLREFRDTLLERVAELEGWIQNGQPAKASYNVFADAQACGERHAPGFCQHDDPIRATACDTEAATLAMTRR